MRPIRSPGESASPCRTKQTMRRATRPAIWTTPTGPCAAVENEAVPLVVLARLVELGVEELPGRVDDARRPWPASGARFTWQSKTLMKTETRRRGLLAEAELARGDAGRHRRDAAVGRAHDELGSTGVTRFGSRKK